MEPETYDQDFYAWAKRNADLIRNGKLSEIDAEHIADELENMGKSQKRELISRLAVLIAHLLKWQYQPERRCDSWVSTTVTQRAEILLLLDDSPSLMHEMDLSIEKAYSYGRDRAAREMGFDKALLPDACPYQFKEMVDSDFWPQ